MTLPRNKKELHEAVYRTLPTSLVQPCVVRSKVEDPTVLLERQQLQQTKSIHELSKIRNLNEMPVPGNLFSLPDVPLPKMRDLLSIVARPPQRSPTPPPPPQVEPEDDQFGLADQIRGTPERSLKGKKKKNRRSQDVETEDVPPPLPPKKLSPSPKKSHLMES